MASKRIDNLAVLDWDDTALIKAYNKGMSLRVKEFEEENVKDLKCNSKKDEWAAGDYCRAVYPADNLVYEAKVLAVSGDVCTVDFLGYDEEVEVDIDTLSKSKGKVARKKQIEKAKEYYPVIGAEESVSGDDSHNDYSDIQSPYRQKRETSHMNHGKHMDHFRDHTAAETTFQHSVYPAPAHCSGMQPATQAMMPPPPPPMLHGGDVAQNPSLCAMLSSWYMAGYYTGLHQGQKGQCHQRCCCRPTQNCCHH